MTTRRGAVALIVGLALVVGGLTGCNRTAGTPVAAEKVSSTTTVTSGSASEATSEATSTLTTTAVTSAAPTGPPVGTAVMKVSGGTGPVTLRYQINGGQEQTETGVSLPWEKEYPVYDKVETLVTADGGDAELMCTIIMNGDKLVTFKTEKRPTCSFAYWG
jgi:glycerate-2-kinase